MGLLVVHVEGKGSLARSCWLAGREETRGREGSAVGKDKKEMRVTSFFRFFFFFSFNPPK